MGNTHMSLFKWVKSLDDPVIQQNWEYSLTLKDNSLKTAEILAATSTGAGEAKIKSSVGALFDFLPQAIKL